MVKLTLKNIETDQIYNCIDLETIIQIINMDKPDHDQTTYNETNWQAGMKYTTYSVLEIDGIGKAGLKRGRFNF